MSWNKALLIGILTYVGFYILSILVFVCLGLGYKYSDLANKISEILSFPFGNGRNYNLLLSALFWSIIIAITIKTIYFYMKKV